MKEGLGSTVLLIILGFLIFYYQGNVDYSMRCQAVSNIVYRYTQTAAKRGELNNTIYNELEKDLKYYGNYTISVEAEKFTSAGIEKLEGSSVIGYDLRKGDYDILSVYIESEKEHWLGAVMKLCFNASGKDYKIKAKASAYIQ